METTIPTICIVNAVDSLRQLVRMSGDADGGEGLISGARAQQDQAIFWLPSEKLLLTEFPVRGINQITEAAGLAGNTLVHLQSGSGDFLVRLTESPDVLHAVKAYAGNNRNIRLFAHTNTEGVYRFAEHLRSTLGIEVDLYEAGGSLAFRDLIDTKGGLRQIAEEIGLSGGQCRTPYGIKTNSLDAAVSFCYDLLQAGRSAIIKCDAGEASLGLIIIESPCSIDSIKRRMQSSPYHRSGDVVVEEFISGIEFPSIEFAIPKDGSPATLLHVCDMLFEGATILRGNVTHIDLYDRPWSKAFIEAGRAISVYLQNQGYAGHFGIDAIADDRGSVFLLDLNSRRTGSTHVHEFAVQVWGPNYIKTRCIGNYDFMGIPATWGVNEIFDMLGELVTDPRSNEHGVVPAELSGLEYGHFGTLIFAPDRRGFDSLVTEIKSRISQI